MKKRKTKVINIKHKEPYDIYIGRINSADFHFGNPFIINIDGNRKQVIEKFRQWLLGKKFRHIEQERRNWILENLPAMKGKTLGCFCKPKPCHGDVYVEVIDK